MVHLTSEATAASVSQATAGSDAPLDLQSFCGDDEQNRAWLKLPFSHGAYTYATNGAYAVRVARRDDAVDAVQPKAADLLDKYWARLANAQFISADLAFPKDDEESHKQECDACDGRGTDHDCPNCDCTCDNCGGSGEETIVEKISVRIFGNLFRLPFIRKIAALPSVEYAVIPDYGSEEPALFRFDGGLAALLPMRQQGDRHFEMPTA